jgi:phosphoadenosine phosphosulfate reductase
VTVELTLARPRRSVADLQGIVAEARELFTDESHPVELMTWFGARLGVDRIAVAVSFSDGVMACLGAKSLPGVDLLFGDTGLHFVETLALREAVSSIYPVTVRSLQPELTVEQQHEQYGDNLWESDPDLCCAMRKTAPMDAALRGYDAWATGLRRADHKGRQDTPMISWDEKHQMIKVNPIVAFSDEQIDACIEEYGIMENPLRQIGYRSIGCEPCTRAVAEGEDERAGRWSGRTKVECGLHL